MPRYLPVQHDAAYEEIQAVYSEVERDFGFVPNYIKTLAHNPHLLKPVADLYRSAVKGPSTLSEKLRQLVILKTCKEDKCKATVAYYTALASEAGWTEEQIKAMDTFSESDLFNYYEKDAMTLVELVLQRPDDISQTDFWTQLDNHFTSDQVVEMITLAGLVNMIDRLMLSVEIEADKNPEVTHPS